MDKDDISPMAMSSSHGIALTALRRTGVIGRSAFRGIRVGLSASDGREAFVVGVIGSKGDSSALVSSCQNSYHIYQIHPDAVYRKDLLVRLFLYSNRLSRISLRNQAYLAD